MEIARVVQAAAGVNSVGNLDLSTCQKTMTVPFRPFPSQITPTMLLAANLFDTYPEQFVVPGPILTEVCYMAESRLALRVAQHIVTANVSDHDSRHCTGPWVKKLGISFVHELPDK